MTNKERLQKLKQAFSLIKEVQLSYGQTDHPHRKSLYMVSMRDFSATGPIGFVIMNLIKFIKQGNL